MKRILTLLITFSLLLTAATGCGKTETPKNSATTTTQQSKTPVSIKVFVAEMASEVQFRDDFPVIVELGKRTGVNMAFQAIPPASFKDKFSLAISSGDLPDVMINQYTEFNKYYDSGAFIKLDKMIDENAPNFKKQLDSDSDYLKRLRAPDKSIYSIPQFTCNSSTTANFIRNDWLKKLNKKVPTTLDEFMDVMKAFRDNDPNGNGKKDEVPWSTRGSINPYIFDSFVSPFGISDDWEGKRFTLENGKVIYGPIDPRYKAALEYMHNLYTEKILDQEFATIDVKLFDAKVANNQVGGLNYWIGSTIAYNTQLKDSVPGIEYVAMPPLKGPAGIQKSWNKGDPMVDKAAAITSKNKYPVETLKMFDYIFSQEGSQLMNFGIDGVHSKVESGKRIYTDAAVKNPKYKDVVNSINDAGLYLPLPVRFENDAYWQVYNSNSAETQARKMYLDNNYYNALIPTLPYTKEEAEERTKLLTDISTYKQEMVIKMIMGLEPLSKYDEFVAQIKKLKIDRLLEIENAAYQRYVKGN